MQRARIGLVLHGGVQILKIANIDVARIGVGGVGDLDGRFLGLQSEHEQLSCHETYLIHLAPSFRGVVVVEELDSGAERMNFGSEAHRAIRDFHRHIDPIGIASLQQNERVDGRAGVFRPDGEILRQIGVQNDREINHEKYEST